MTVLRARIISIFFVIISHKLLMAGPPFITDDPDAVPYKHGETYLGSIGFKSKKEFYAFVPLFEANYGAFKDIHLHMIAPFTVDKKTNQSTHYGPGIIELGVKYRIIHETDKIPQIGIFPLIELPTGNSGEGLGTGKTQFFLPVWMQKSWGKKVQAQTGHDPEEQAQEYQDWTAYGGGGYWINPGVNNKNFWFFGVVIQRQVTNWLWLGIENFYQTKAKKDDRASYGFNIGGGITLQKDWQVIFSFGKSTGLGQFLYYVALYHTW